MNEDFVNKLIALEDECVRLSVTIRDARFTDTLSFLEKDLGDLIATILPILEAEEIDENLVAQAIHQYQENH